MTTEIYCPTFRNFKRLLYYSNDMVCDCDSFPFLPEHIYTAAPAEWGWEWFQSSPCQREVEWTVCGEWRVLRETSQKNRITIRRRKKKKTHIDCLFSDQHEPLGPMFFSHSFMGQKWMCVGHIWYSMVVALGRGCCLWCHLLVGPSCNPPTETNLPWSYLRQNTK